uniref:Zona pellucida binding protein n=1 Tax=Vombatus ursinus TaxID=29139 RepID=A0A4X2L952_VOMUR
MEGAARVLLRRARERRHGRSCRTQCFPSLSLLLLLFVHFQTSLSIRYIYPARYLRQILEDEDTVKLVGSTNIPENSVKVTTTGSLIFYNFSEEMSGVYTCSLSYKHTAEDAQKIIQVKYVVYAFINPDFYYQFTARYHSAPCNSIYNVSFEKKLLHILRTLLADLSCDISSVKTECHRIKMQKSGLQNELFFTFSVICKPGTYNPHNGTQCLRCNSSMVYGAKKC